MTPFETGCAAAVAAVLAFTAYEFNAFPVYGKFADGTCTIEPNSDAIAEAQREVTKLVKVPATLKFVSLTSTPARDMPSCWWEMEMTIQSENLFGVPITNTVDVAVAPRPDLHGRYMAEARSRVRATIPSIAAPQLNSDLEQNLAESRRVFNEHMEQSRRDSNARSRQMREDMARDMRETRRILNNGGR